MASTRISRIPVRTQTSAHSNAAQQNKGPSVAALANLRFLISSLSQKDRELLDSTVNGEDVLRDVLTNEEIAKNPRAVARLRAVIEGLEPFFAALDTASQADPMHFAVAWAGLRVIIQGITNLSTFFQKVISSLDVMTDEIAYFSRVRTKIFKFSTASEPIKCILDEAYEQLLLYLIGIIRIFYQTTGERKSTIRILARAAWKPFRLESTLSTLKNLKVKLRDEISLLDLGRGRRPAQRSNASERREFNESQHFFSHRVKRWLAPPTFTDAYDHALQQKAPGTSEWLADNASFSFWYNQSRSEEGFSIDDSEMSNPSFWIYGKPGAGKTVLAGSLINLLKNDLRNSPNCIVCYFFFDSLSPGENRASDAYRAILAQIVQRRSDHQLLMDLFAFAMWSDSDGQLKASPSEAAELLQLSIGLLSRDKIYIILDGLDECADLPTNLRLLLEPPRELKFLNLVCFSRDTVIPHLKKEIPRYEIRIGQLNLDDIYRYSLLELRCFVQDQILPDGIDFESVATSLSQRSDGMFLWARLMVQYLRSPNLLISERIEAISETNLPENLDKMYSRILSLASKSPKRAARVKCILSWLYQSIRAVNILELEEALICSSGRAPSKPSDRFTDFRQDISTICGGLVELSTAASTSNDGANTTVKFIHSSVKEYLDNGNHYIEQNANINRGILPSARWANAHIARVCLQYLTFSVPAEPLTSIINFQDKESRLQDIFPMIGYALSFWPQHILAIHSNEHQSIRIDEDAAKEYSSLLLRLHQFLTQPKVVSAWIEATSIYGLSLPIAGVKQVASKLDTSTASNHKLDESFNLLMPSFTNYLESIDENWRLHLLKDPICIWEEISAFHPSKFNEAVPGVLVRPLATMEPSQPEIWPKPISNVSRMILGTTIDIAISVFATKAFMDCYAQPHRHSELFRDLKFSRGWLLKVEIVDSDNADEIMNISIPIDPHEVSLQLYQTLFLESLHFPLSISPTGTHLACLRTVFTLTQYKPTLRYVTSIIPLHLNQDMLELWSIPQDEDSLFRIDEYPRLRKPQALSQVYLYWVHFDNHGRDLIVAEQVTGLPIALTIFQLAKTTPNSQSVEVTRINRRHVPFKLQTSQWGGRRALAEKLFEVAFHPSLPVIAIGTRLGGYIWDYLSPKPRSMKSVITWQENPNKIGFSNDGTTLFLRSALGTTRVNVQEHLAEISISQMSIPGNRISPASTSATDASDTNTSTAETILTGLNPIQGNRVISPENILHTKYGELVATMRNSGEKAELSITNASKHEDIVLTRIPNIDESETIEASAILPRSGGQHIKVVLDQGPKTWHNLGKVGALDDVALPFPLVVSRDLSTLRQAQSITLLAETDSTSAKGKERQITG
ncbi:hypothetical protein ANO14919_044810 [Xylariales sp. No.14919]|nr:hypothetical protein ANO14919_044810 [Xylariales sp. No.14919]